MQNSGVKKDLISRVSASKIRVPVDHIVSSIAGAAQHPPAQVGSLLYALRDAVKGCGNFRKAVLGYKNVRTGPFSRTVRR